MITVDHHLRALTVFGGNVNAIADGWWDHPVPACPGWDVEVLVSHVTIATARVARLLDGDDPDQVDEFVDRHCDGVDGPIRSWRRAFADARAVLDQTTLDRPVRLRTGDAPAVRVVAEACCETLVHTWDLATAIGADPRLDDVLVDACRDAFDEFEDAWRERGAIGPRVAVGPDADAQTTWLARFGRMS
jgi:uncharacterized protein (TIGR03086 family)